MKIAEVFEQIAKEENHQFKVGVMYKPKKKFKVETPDGFQPVTKMIIKEDKKRNLIFDDYVIVVSEKHKIKTPEGFRLAKDIKPGDVVLNTNYAAGIKLIKNEEVNYGLVYDIGVDSVEHEYLDAAGFIHHNTWGITDPAAPNGLPKLLGPEGGKWTLHTGMKASPLTFYKTVFQERDKIIVLDEADNILKNQEIIIMLKAMLDSGGENYASYATGTTNMVGKSPEEVEEYARYVDSEIADGAEITQQPEKSGYVRLPSKFKFTGGIIFISNMPADKIDEAIMSRSIFIDIHLAEQDRLKRVQTVGRKMAENDPDISESDMEEILAALGSTAPISKEPIKYITPEYARKTKEISLRAISLGIAIKKSGLKNADRLIALYS